MKRLVIGLICCGVSGWLNWLTFSHFGNAPGFGALLEALVVLALLGSGVITVFDIIFSWRQIIYRPPLLKDLLKQAKK